MGEYVSMPAVYGDEAEFARPEFCGREILMALNTRAPQSNLKSRRYFQ
jgi:hypothetical protein